MNSACQAVLDGSHAIAIEQALWAVEAGYTPREVIEACGHAWSARAPSWDDAVYVLAMAWRRQCAGNVVALASRRAA
ncbi:MAG: hypothetical protein H7841_08415 [Magnetospirillum sp. WYHS-4]